MKKLVTLLLVLALTLSVSSALAYSPENPITIDFWHTRGSGANADSVNRQVETFNNTIGKEKGIIVVPSYQGSYADNVTKMCLALQSNTQPVVGVTSSAHTALLLDENVAADMAPYMAETGFDINVFFDCFLDVPAIHDGRVEAVPYIRSTPVFYYNKTMADAKGLKAPETVAEMAEFCKALSVVDEKTGEVLCYGLELLTDASFQEGAFMWSNGTPWLSEDASHSPALTEGGLLKLMTDWRSWIDEGWCRPFDATNASSICQQMFYQGKIAAFNGSCGSLANIKKYTEEAGYELGVCYLPAYNLETRNIGIGGGNLILVNGNSEEKLRAGWEFINFLVSKEQVALEAQSTGYLPSYKDMSGSSIIEYWEENPLAKVAYEQLAWGHANETPYFPERQEYMANVTEALSVLIQEGSITAQEAFDQVVANTAHLWTK